MYSKFSIEELTQILNSLAFIQESVTFTVSETGRDTKGTDFLWSGIILKENIKAVSEAIKAKSASEGRTVSEAIAEVAGEASDMLTADEMEQLHEIGNDPFELISASFAYGYAQGVKSAK